jgi:hypothetical protein
MSKIRNMNEIVNDTIVISNDLIKVVERSIATALEYETATQGSRKLGITGEIGEILVCKQMKLKMMKDPRSIGYDAVDSNGYKVQIKTRRGESGNTPRETGRLGRFSTHKFDYALLGILDDKYQLTEIWRSEYKVIEPIISSQKRRNPGISTFKRVAHKIFPD